ncbi:MAG TPA: glycine--tRNA ligase subunit beta [Candidatus Saccharimonadales bacterium]|nr:glycine--tRNA ligase subunit beta [Candidatus Saccharimonadales bacterium]
MADIQEFLVEIGTEELPPKSLERMARDFHHLILSGLKDAKLMPPNSLLENGERYFSPRRLAVYVPAVQLKQTNANEERLGPNVSVAFNTVGKPTPAAEGFARSCGVTVSQLERRQTEKGERLVCTLKIKGKTAAELLPQIVSAALAKLPIPKRMRWGAGETQFVRPVHWAVMLLGEKPLKVEILGVTADNKTYGHRFLHPAAITLKRPGDYRKALVQTGKVLVEDSAGTLAKKIGMLVTQTAKRAHGQAQLDPGLLEEVTALVEWPVPVTGNFDKKFLTLPDEVIVAVLETQQRYFPLRDAKGKLLPHFVAISNIKSKKPAEVRRGNERVVVPRLTDAMFFWDNDCKMRLGARFPELERVVFQKNLGSYGEKSRRVVRLAGQIAAEISGDPQLAERAGKLCKCDLVTGMVGEFPELQGIMGGYYARHDREPEEVARAIAEHYHPRFAGDALPTTKTGQALAIADKLDTITGIFSMGQKSTGEKDPFGLRRAGLGLMRIIIEGHLNVDLVQIILFASTQISSQNKVQTEASILEFLLDRLRAYYLEIGIRADVFESVRVKLGDINNPMYPLDFDARVQAVNTFLSLPEAKSLAAANKRISNILRQAGGEPLISVDPTRFETPDEKRLHTAVETAAAELELLLSRRDYVSVLSRLVKLRAPVDDFFDKVLVMTDNTQVKNNRLALLAHLRSLFLHTADLALIQTD